MICDAWDLVVVPFPFTDRETAKRRPALVLSDRPFNANGHSVLTMVTSAAHSAWPSDTRVQDLDAAGLTSNSVVRLKLFTLDNRFILRALGRLESRDRSAVTHQLRQAIPPLV